MSFIELKDVSKYYNKRCLYTNVNVNISMGDKVVVLGENGVGKTTLLNIMACETEVDSGNVKADQDNIFYLNQLFDFPQNIFVDEYIDRLFGEAMELEKKVRLKADELSKSGMDAAAMQEYAELYEKFESKGGYSFLEEMNRFIHIFGLHEMTGKRCRELSGGQKQYLRLALSLFSDKDIIFLDEPGSCLDGNKVDWLVNYIKASTRTFVVVSHDIHIVKSIATRVIDISNGEVNLYPCSYHKYLEARERYRTNRRQGNRECEKEIQKKIATITKKIEWMGKAENKHRHAVTIRRLQREIETLKREKLVFDNNSYSYAWKMSKTEAEKQLYVSVDGIKKSYGNQRVLSGCSLDIYSDSHIMITGENGCGKTTLLKLITGKEKPDEGSVIVEDHVSIEMAQQDFPTETGSSILAYCIKKSGKGIDAVENALLRLFDERKTDINSDISLLSGGERKRLEIMIKMISGPDLLILDEPTVYMDQYSRNRFYDLLDRFLGAVLIVTHDKEFINDLSGKNFTALRMGDGRIVKIPQQEGERG